MLLKQDFTLQVIILKYFLKDVKCLNVQSFLGDLGHSDKILFMTFCVTKLQFNYY